MKKILLLLLAAILCLSLCSCDTILKKAKTAVTGEEESEMPEDYIATLENDQFSYEVYEEYIKLTKYTAIETSVEIPSEIDGKPVTTIGSLCFHDTEALVTSVNIPSSVTTIEESAFYYADHLLTIRIPDSVTKIGSRAFAWCNSLESVSFGAGVTEIPDYCFNHCASLTTLIIPSKITKIGIRAFSYCDNLIEMVVPSNVLEVGERAFAGCPMLEFVTINNDSVQLGKNIFEECERLSVIASENSNAMNYCAEYQLRWSTSKDIEAIIIVTDESSVEESNTSADTESE